MLGDDRNLHVTNIVYGERGYEADGTVVAKFDDKYEAPEVPEKPKKPETPKQTVEIKKATLVSKKSILPKTDDANQSLITMTASLTAVGLMLVALGLRKARNHMQ